MLAVYVANFYFCSEGDCEAPFCTEALHEDTTVVLLGRDFLGLTKQQQIYYKKGHSADVTQQHLAASLGNMNR